MLTEPQRREFIEDGYTVVPQVVSASVINAARLEIRDMLSKEPMAVDHRGPHSYFLPRALQGPLAALLFDSPAISIAETLTAPGRFEAPDHVQIALNIPPWNHRPGGPHIDGVSPPETSGRPGTFTLLVGIFLTDQSREFAGNLWVWPGSHRQTAAYLIENGPESILPAAPYPPVNLGEPRQVTGRAGDLLLAHYLLGHNTGGNTSDQVREAVYFRLRRENHREQWRDAVQDPFFEFPSLRTTQHR